MRSTNVVRMKKAKKCRIVRAIDACATIAGRHAGLARPGHARWRRKIGKAAVHAETGASATTGEGAMPATRAATRVPAAGRLGKAGKYRCAPNDERAAPAALPAPIHRPALLIQPYSLFCILLVGELPTDFPDRAVGESQV
ncbi:MULTISPECIES: hypothetical protein [Burkholderia cepacia complex]|uniref:hypothetical protein n=1 Tax=Burkholderia cepacia complex TaxID=87882 RepID=UPI0009E57CF7|nr:MULTISPECIES: hypothetical protein [Burkholderia cepacia complex]